MLAEQTGVQLSFFLGDELVAVAGVALPLTTDLPHTITDLAVQPERRGQGIGSVVLAMLLAAEEFAVVRLWEAYVAPDNFGAQRFFEQRGWAQIAAANDEDMMLTYRCSGCAAASAIYP